MRDRPHLDGSMNDSVWSLIFARNGFGRLVGSGSLHHVAAAAGGGSASGIPGVLRLLTAPFATQIGWFVPPAALALLLCGVRRAKGQSPDMGHMAYLLWGLWLVVVATVFSFMSGPMHPYYTVLMAPAAAALVGMGAVDLVRPWSPSRDRRRRGDRAGGTGQRHAWAAAGVMLVSAGWAGLLAQHTHGLPRWLALAVGGGGIATALAIGGLPRWPRASRHRQLAIALMTSLTLLAAPLAMGIATDGRSVTGANPLAGPGPSAPELLTRPLAAFIRAHRGTATWGAAVVTATPAARLQLDSGVPVLPIGGFMGSVPAPTLTDFRDWVSEGRLRYLVLDGPYQDFPPDATPGGLAGTQAASIVAWARTHGLRLTVPGDAEIVYDLAPGRSRCTPLCR
jgi:4-amino-4-deoxy-L-arabinose transferase-like glycosyltransferase